MHESRFGGLLKWRWDRLRHPLPPDHGAASLTLATPSVRHPAAPPHEISVTWVGHSTLLMQVAGVNVLTDPMWGESASPFRLVRVPRLVAPGLPFERLPRIDAVLLSHNHYDHLDAPTVRRLAGEHAGAQWFVPLRLGKKVRSYGVTHVTELDWWEEARVRSVTVTSTPARHFSARTPFDRNRTLWCGFALRAEACRVFYAGDTGFHPEFPRIGEQLGPFDLSALPVGAYEPRWFMNPVHMNPDEAVEAFLSLHAPHETTLEGTMVGVHWGTFRLTDEPLLEPPRRTMAAWDRRSLPRENLWLLAHGETRSRTLVAR